MLLFDVLSLHEELVVSTESNERVKIRWVTLQLPVERGLRYFDLNDWFLDSNKLFCVEASLLLCEDGTQVLVVHRFVS